MRRRATLVIDRKLTFDDGSILQAVVWELPHIMGEENPYTFRDIPSLLADFRNEIERCEGKS